MRDGSAGVKGDRSKPVASAILSPLTVAVRMPKSWTKVSKPMEYTFEELQDDVALGRAIDFYYKGHKFFISNAVIENKRRWFLSKFGDHSYQSFDTVDQLLRDGTIYDRHIKDIWSEVEIDTVF